MNAISIRRAAETRISFLRRCKENNRAVLEERVTDQKVIGRWVI
jgi:hypothetical protein